jgi:hypothetical protein
MEIAVVMGDSYDRSSVHSQLWQQFKIKEFPELWILIRCPFIEQYQRAVLKQRRDQRQSLALPGG